MMIAFITLFMFSSCSKDKTLPDQALEFDLVILDKNGVKTSTLKQGEDFFIGFEVTNRSDDTVFASHEDGWRLYQQFYKQHGFLSVYQKVYGISSPQFIYIGKPYDPDVELNFQANNLPGYFLRIHPYGRQYIFHAASWFNNPMNRPLSAGRYYSHFADTTSIEGNKITIDTSIEFEVN